MKKKPEDTVALCPFCGSEDIARHVNYCTAEPTRDEDRAHYDAWQLEEHQCRNCARSFWS